MSRTHLIAAVASSFGYHSNEARRLAKAGRTLDARWHAKHSRSDLRSLLHLSGQPSPPVHRTADSFAA